MILTFSERSLLLQLLPAEGNILTLREVTNLRLRLAATKEEIEQYHIKQTDNIVRWDEDFTMEIEVPENMKEIIKSNLIDLNNQSKLKIELLGLYEKFVEEKGND